MEKAGVPLRQSITVAAEDTGRGVLASALPWMLQDMQAGRTLSEAMAAHPRLFDRSLVTLVAAGEKTGRMAFVFGKCVLRCKAIDAHKRDMRKATRHFKISSLVMLALLLFQGLNDVPLMVAWLVGMVGLLVLLYRYAPFLRFVADHVLLGLPLLGRFIRRVDMQSFAENLSLFYATGVPLREGLSAAAQSASNAALRRDLQSRADAVAAGAKISAAFAKGGLIDKTAARMLKVGEDTGNLSATMDELASYYAVQTDAALTAIRQYAAPALTIVLGVALFVLF